MEAEVPTLAICIPTFNRSRYLENLLQTVHRERGKFRHSYEIIISDNASADNTEAMIEPWLDKLPIRYFRQDKNIGPFRSLAFAYEQSDSPFTMYLADDDLLDIDGLNAAMDTLLADPETVVLYAPWTLIDLVNNKVLQNFYELPADNKVMRGNFLHLLSLILQNHIFAEISIFRTEAYRSLLPIPSDCAHWAFTVPAEYLSLGNVMFCRKPFYKSVTNYFPGQKREQLGVDEVETAWDSYRGGLEHLVGLCTPHLNEKNLEILNNSIREFVILRMSVALKIRMAKGRNPINCYYLASRLRGLGALQLLPKPWNTIRSEAVLWFISHEPTLIDGMRQIALIGEFEESIRDHLNAISDTKAIHLQDLPHEIEFTLLVFKGSRLTNDIDVAHLRARSNRIVFEEELLNKFR